MNNLRECSKYASAAFLSWPVRIDHYHSVIQYWCTILLLSLRVVFAIRALAWRYELLGTYDVSNALRTNQSCNQNQVHNSSNIFSNIEQLFLIWSSTIPSESHPQQLYWTRKSESRTGSRIIAWIDKNSSTWHRRRYSTVVRTTYYWSRSYYHNAKTYRHLLWLWTTWNNLEGLY